MASPKNGGAIGDVGGKMGGGSQAETASRWAGGDGNEPRRLKRAEQTGTDGGTIVLWGGGHLAKWANG